MEGFQWWSMPGVSCFVLSAVLFLSAAATASEANMAGDLDEHWQRRKLISDAAAEATYRHDPFEVTDSFNRAVHRHDHDDVDPLYISVFSTSRVRRNGGACWPG
ncbi:hypothetical protein ABZP36_011620 [Zizania latifolia]